MIVIRLKVDENLPIEVARRLNDVGHDALSVLDQKMGGASDEAVARDGSNTVSLACVSQPHRFMHSNETCAGN